MRYELDFWRGVTLALALIAFTASTTPAATADPAAGVWTKDTNGTTRHAQSGFVCPNSLLTSRENRRSLDSIALQTVIVGTSRPKGDEVGCEYEGRNGAWATVEFIRLRPGEAAQSHYEAKVQHIKARFPTVLGVSDTAIRPTSPTGGRTYAVGYYNAQVGDRRGAVSAVAGEVGGWMITVIQFDYESDGSALKQATAVNWQRIVDSRR